MGIIATSHSICIAMFDSGQMKISGHRGMVVIPLQNYKNYKEMIPILDLYFSGKRMVADQPLRSWKIF
jgi:hypothetical protein